MLACLMAAQAAADPYVLSLGADIRYFDYEEFGASSQSLDHETGFIPGIKIAGEKFAFALRHMAEFGIWGGGVDYDGQTQSGQPHRTKTDETIYRLLYRIDWQPTDDDGSLYAKACWQNWDRDIMPADGVSGLFERYQWWTIEAGLRATLWQQPNHSLAFELGVLKTSYGTIQIDLSDSGYGKPVLDLGDGLGASVSLEYALKLTSSKRMRLGIGYRRWKFGRSNNKAVSNGASTIIITEPDSLSNQITLSVGYQFQY
jgi:hypothetical protein